MIDILKRLFFWRDLPDPFKNAVRSFVFFVPNRIKVSSILKGSSCVKVEFGSGKREGMEGWVSADLIDRSADLRLDASRRSPFSDNSVAAVYSSHLMEHMDIRKIRYFLKECLRILKPGGSFSVAVPNAGIYIEAYSRSLDLDPFYLRYGLTGLTYSSKIDYVNHIAYMGGAHRHMFDEKALTGILEDAGFKGVKIRGFIPGLDVEARKTESIYAEAVK
jgi:predicted SAM-dependent methyltransferase